MSSIAVIMVGGPTTSNFRALGSVPAPLFPIAGRALLHHPITAAAAVPGITAVYVLGFYEERDFAPYLATMSAEVGVPVRYLCESRGHGSAGGLHQFRDTLLQENPGSVFLLNCDVCCAFPLVGTCLAARRARVCAAHAPLSAASRAAAARCRAAAGAASHAALLRACDRDHSTARSPARRRERNRRQRAHAQRTRSRPAALITSGVRSALRCAARAPHPASLRARRGAARLSTLRLSPLGTSLLRCAELLAAHHSHPSALGTMLVKRVPEAKARECGEVVADEATGELLHYIERPETCAPDNPRSHTPRTACCCAVARRTSSDRPLVFAPQLCVGHGQHRSVRAPAGASQHARMALMRAWR